MTDVLTIVDDVMDNSLKEFAKCDFFLQTPSVSAMSKLFYGLQDLTPTVTLKISSDGIHICERMFDDNVLVFVNIPAKKLEKLKIEGISIIKFDLSAIYKFINKAEQQDVMIWKFNKKKPDILIINLLRQGSDLILSEFEIKLLPCTSSECSAPPAEVDYFLGLDSSIVVNYINGLVSMKKDFQYPWVTISCNRTEISFSRNDGFMIPYTKFTLLSGQSHIGDKKRKRKHKKIHDDDELSDHNYTRKIIQDPVSQQYCLQYLSQLVKCLSMDKLITVYVKKDFPIIFNVDVGDIGTLRAVVMFNTDIEST